MNILVARSDLVTGRFIKHLNGYFESHLCELCPSSRRFVLSEATPLLSTSCAVRSRRIGRTQYS